MGMTMEIRGTRDFGAPDEPNEPNGADSKWREMDRAVPPVPPIAYGSNHDLDVPGLVPDERREAPSRPSAADGLADITVPDWPMAEGPSEPDEAPEEARPPRADDDLTPSPLPAELRQTPEEPAAPPAAAAGGGGDRPPVDPPDRASADFPNPDEPDPQEPGQPERPQPDPLKDYTLLAELALRRQLPGQEPTSEQIASLAGRMATFASASGLQPPEDPPRHYDNPRDRSPNDQLRQGGLVPSNVAHEDRPASSRYLEARTGDPDAPSETPLFAPDPSLRTRVEVVHDEEHLTIRNLDIRESDGLPLIAEAERAVRDGETGVATWPKSTLCMSRPRMEFRANGPDPSDPDWGADFFARVSHGGLSLKVYDGPQEMGLAGTTRTVLTSDEALAVAVQAGFPGGMRYNPPIIVDIDMIKDRQVVVYEHPGGRRVEEGWEREQAANVAAALKPLFAQYELEAALTPDAFVVRDTEYGLALTLFNAAGIRRQYPD